MHTIFDPNKDSYLFPPRPASKINPNVLSRYEDGRHRGKWVCQRKFNGTRIVIFVSADRNKCYMLTRHGTVPKQFRFENRHAEQVLSLNLEPGKDYWLDGELLNNKTANLDYKDRIVLFDVLHAGKYLFGSPDQMARLALLADICGHPTELESGGIAHVVTPNIWMAQTWDTDFVQHYKEKLDADEIEGLVLRRKNSALTDFGRKEYECDWILRCRKPHTSYRF